MSQQTYLFIKKHFGTGLIAALFGYGTMWVVKYTDIQNDAILLVLSLWLLCCIYTATICFLTLWIKPTDTIIGTWMHQYVTFLYEKLPWYSRPQKHI